MDEFAPVRFEDGRPLLLAGLRRRHDFAAADLGIVEQWREFQARPSLPGRTGPRTYGVMCGHDATGFEYMCGEEVESFAGLPEGTGKVRVPPQRYAVFAHDDPGVPLRSTWERVLAWLDAGAYDSAHTPDFELYGPDAEPPSGGPGVEVWVGVVPRRVPGDVAQGGEVAP